MAQYWTIARLQKMLFHSAFGPIALGLALVLSSPASGLEKLEAAQRVEASSSDGLLTSLSSRLSMEEARSQLLDLTRFPLSLPPASGTLSASSDRLSPTEISKPSLTWIQEQVGERYGSDRLVAQWQAYQGNSSDALSYVDVIVDEQIWDLLSYFERYAFIAQFGVAAKQYGYHLRVFHSGDVLNYRDAQNAGSSRPILLRGAHVCGFANVPVSTSVPVDWPIDWPIDPGAASDIPCEIVLNEASRRDGQ